MPEFDDNNSSSDDFDFDSEWESFSSSTAPSYNDEEFNSLAPEPNAESNGMFIDTFDTLSDGEVSNTMVGFEPNQNNTTNSQGQQNNSFQQYNGFNQQTPTPAQQMNDFSQNQGYPQQSNQQFTQNPTNNQFSQNQQQNSFSNNFNQTTQFNNRNQGVQQQNQQSYNNVNAYWQNQNNFENTQQAQQQNQGTTKADIAKYFTNLSMKSVGLLLILIVIIILFLVLFFSRLKIKPKTDNQVTNAQQVTSQENTVQDSTNNTDAAVVSNQDNSQVRSNTVNTTQVANNSLALVEIPSTTKSTMSDEVLETTGVVSGFKRYLYNGQIVYCIYVNVNIGGTSKDVAYFCNYASYKAVNKGDNVTVRYQLVDTNYVSILEMFKN